MNVTDHALRVVRIIDGDTLIGDLEHVVGISEGVEILTRRKNVGLRLINLQTPERKHPDFGTAKADLATWVVLTPNLRVRTYGPDDIGRRLLADVYGADGRTATEHMLLLGWQPYVKAKR